MSTNTIDAKLRIAADVAQAIAQLQALRKEITSTNTAARGASTAATPGADPAAAAAARKARDEAKQAAAAAIAQRRADAAEEARINAGRVAAEQQAQRQVRAATNIQTQAFRQLPAQITDVVTSLASGQPVFQVAIQQGGQIKDSFGGFSAAAKALASTLTPLRLVVGGLVGVLATIAAAAASGALQSDALRKSLALTGQAGSISLAQIDAQARGIAASTGASIGSVRDTLAALVAQGSETSTTLAGTARAVTAYRKLTGAGAEESVKLFAGQRDAVLDWARKANGAYQFLTATQLDHIRTLQAQGREDEAVRFANEELAKSLEQRTAPAIGLLERGWNGVKAAISGVFDALKGIGRDDTAEQKIAALKDRLAELNRPAGKLDRTSQLQFENSKAERQALEQEIANAERVLNADKVRQAERSAAAKLNNEAIIRDSKAFRETLAQVDVTAAQKLLAQKEAQIARERDLVENSVREGVLSEAGKFTALAALEQQRLRAQEAFVQRQIEIEEKVRKVETPADTEARKGTLNGLQAQLVSIRAQIGAATAEGLRKATDAGIEDSRAKAQQYADAMVQALSAVRAFVTENADRTARALAEPFARANAEAEAATAEARRQFAELQRELGNRLSLTVDPGQRAELVKQIEALATEGAAALGERERRARFESLQQQLAEQADALRQQEADLAALVERGALTTEEAEAKKLAAREKSIPQLEQILRLLRETAAAGSTAEQNAVAGAAATVGAVTDLRTEFEKTARSSGINELAQGLTDVLTGAKSAGQALRDMALGFAKTMLNVLNQRLAEKLVDSLLKAADGFKIGGGGGLGDLFQKGIGFVASLFHTGGVAGGGMQRMSRAVLPAVFAGAQVLHSGGIAGLRANEVPTILERGEEVLTADDPRHTANGGGGVVVHMPVTISGASGSNAEQGASLADLQQMMQATVDQWAIKMQRQGGILAGRGYGRG